MLKFLLLNGLYLSLKWSKDFCLQILKPESPFWPQGSEGSAASWHCQMASSAVRAHLAEGFPSVLWMSPGRRRAFWGMRERTWNTYVLWGIFACWEYFLWRLLFTLWFFPSPLGWALFFFTKRKDVAAYRPGGEEACLCCLCCIHLWVLYPAS